MIDYHKEKKQAQKPIISVFLITSLMRNEIRKRPFFKLGVLLVQ